MRTKNVTVISGVKSGLTAGLVLAVFGSASPCHANAAGDVHFKKGLQLSQQKKWSAAEAEYRKAIALDPKNASYRSYLADCLAAQGKFDQAQNSYDQSTKIKKNTSAGGRRPTGLQDGKHGPPMGGGSSGRSTGSSRSNGSSSSTSSSRSNGSSNPTGSSFPTGRSNDSRSTGSSRSTGTLPNFPLPGDNGRSRQGEDTKRVGTRDPGHTVTRQDEGVEIIEPSIPEETNPHFLKGQELGDEGKWAAAEREYLLAVQQKPKSSEIWRALGDVYFKQSKWQNAEQAHRQAVRLQPEEGYYRAQLAEALLKLGRRNDAIKEAREAKRLGLIEHDVFDELGMTGDE